MANNYNILADISDIIGNGTKNAIEPLVKAEASARGDVRRNERACDKFHVDSKPTIRSYISFKSRACRKAEEVEDYEEAVREALRDGDEATARALLEDSDKAIDEAETYAYLLKTSKPVIEGIVREYNTLTDIYEESKETAEFAEAYADMARLTREANRTIKRNGGSLKMAKERNNEIKDKAVSEFGAESFEFMLRTGVESGAEKKEYYLNKARARKRDQRLEEIKVSMYGAAIPENDTITKEGDDK